MAVPAAVLRQVAAAIKQRGALIQIQHVDRLPGPEPFPSPPVCVSPVLAANISAGDTTIDLNAVSAEGRLIPGDIITISKTTYTVEGAIRSRAYSADPSMPDGFDAIAISPHIAADAPAGTSVGINYANEEDVWAVLEAFPARLVDGQLIQVNDYQVTIAGLNRQTLNTADMLVINGSAGTIVKADPVYVGGWVARWNIQAR